MAGGAGQTVRFMQFDAGPVKGAPYAAEAANETIQTLQDGNRIVEKHSSKMYRDAEGRTRMENNFSTLGPLVPGGNDPVSGENFILDNNRKTATKMVVPKFAMSGKPGERREVRMEVRHGGPAGSSATATATVDHDVMMAGPVMMQHKQMAESLHLAGGATGADVKKEALGKQVIEGVECEGTRETVTIPVGAMGSERPLVSVTERWVSAKLSLDVLRKHTALRFGETTYKLTRIVQADQPRSLFEVPADYKVEEGGGNVFFNKKDKEVKD